MKKKLKNLDKKYPWLTVFEAKALMSKGYFDSEGALHNTEGCVRCTSVVKSHGNRCRNFAESGELFCRIHGGLRARKKIGRQRIYSAFIEDASLKNVYEESLNEEEVQGIREELALLRALLADIIRKVGLKDVRSVMGIARIIGEIRLVIKDCTATQINLGQLIDIGKVTLVVKALSTIIAKYVKDTDTIEKIANEFDNVIWPATFASTPQPIRKTPSREVSRLSGEICEGSNRRSRNTRPNSNVETIVT